MQGQLNQSNMRILNMLLIFCMALIGSCAKDKEDPLLKNQLHYPNIPSSSTRLIFAKNMELEINGNKLTNWQGERSFEIPKIPPYPTKYFPTSGKPGDAYAIPQEFFSNKNKASINIYATGSQQKLASFEASENNDQPIDYYLYAEKMEDITKSTAQVPRYNILPKNPKNILIRILNLATESQTNVKPNETVSLTFADGKNVNPKTSNIANGKWSEYVEIPYGTYDFHVVVDGSERQCHAVPFQQISVTSDMDFSMGNANLYFTQKRLFQPGAVYTVAVTLSGKYENLSNFSPIYLNSFHIVTDRTPSVNMSYCKIQLINVLNKNKLTGYIDGQPIGDLSYGQAEEAKIYGIGQHEILIKDAAGKEILKKNIITKGGDNLSLWIFPTKSQTPDLSIIQNNMSGFINEANSPDGADGLGFMLDPLASVETSGQVRFLNFCPEIPYATFTKKDGQPFFPIGTNPKYENGSSNLELGKIPQLPTVRYPYLSIYPTTIEVYSSELNKIPGNRLINVPVLTKENFVNFPLKYYPNGLPSGEPGTYTIALIGHFNAAENPKMIVIKHNN